MKCAADRARALRRVSGFFSGLVLLYRDRCALGGQAFGHVENADSSKFVNYKTVRSGVRCHGPRRCGREAEAKARETFAGRAAQYKLLLLYA